MATKLRAFVLYGADDTVISMSLLRLRQPPKTHLNWVEVSQNICCFPDNNVIQSGKSKLRAFLGLDSRGNVLNGPIVRLSMPKNGRWLEIKYNLCCDTSVAPGIATQPQDQSAAAGTTATFSVVAIGTPTSYQWQLDSGSGFADISGATSASYTTPPLISGNSGNEYQVVITFSGSTVTSDSATLTVTA